MDVGERSYLLNEKKQHCPSLKRKFKYSFIFSKQIILYLIWMGMTLTVSTALPETLINVKSKMKVVYRYVFSACFLMIYVLYPVYGYIGEKWTRFYIILTGAITIGVPALFVEIVAISCGPSFFGTHQKIVSALVTVFLLLGQGIIAANAVQFGLDQIQSAPSPELASYTRWTVFVLFLSLFTANSLGNISYTFPKATVITYILGAILAMLTLGSLIIGFCFKYLLIIEPPSNVDPLKLNWKVLKYAMNHKNPVNRSAFTYSDDPPSRLDFGKNRYGGPFTTDEVEDVKSFWNVLAITLSSSLSFNFDLKDSYFYQLPGGNISLTTASEKILFYSSDSRCYMVLVILILQLVIVPLFPSLILGIMKRIWIGLTLNFLSFLAATIISLAVDSNHLVKSLIFISISSAIGTAIVSCSSLEFILAQAPCRMQGLLFGFWGIQFAFEPVLVSFHPPLHVLYSTSTGLTLLSLILFSVAMYRYRYRVRNEPSDINVRSIVEEIYERELSSSRDDFDFDNFDAAVN